MLAPSRFFEFIGNIEVVARTITLGSRFSICIGLAIQKTYPQSKVRLEYCPTEINPNMHIDILVMIGDEWFPSEL